jgi:hypothetical protein
MALFSHYFFVVIWKMQICLTKRVKGCILLPESSNFTLKGGGHEPLRKEFCAKSSDLITVSNQT